MFQNEVSTRSKSSLMHITNLDKKWANNLHFLLQQKAFVDELYAKCYVRQKVKERNILKVWILKYTSKYWEKPTATTSVDVEKYRGVNAFVKHFFK